MFEEDETVDSSLQPLLGAAVLHQSATENVCFVAATGSGCEVLDGDLRPGKNAEIKKKTYFAQF